MASLLVSMFPRAATPWRRCRSVLLAVDRISPVLRHVWRTKMLLHDERYCATQPGLHGGIGRHDSRRRSRKRSFLDDVLDDGSHAWPGAGHLTDDHDELGGEAGGESREKPTQMIRHAIDSAQS